MQKMQNAFALKASATKNVDVFSLACGKSIAPYCSVVFVFCVLFAFLVVKRAFHMSYSVVFCREMS